MCIAVKVMQGAESVRDPCQLLFRHMRTAVEVFIQVCMLSAGCQAVLPSHTPFVPRTTLVIAVVNSVHDAWRAVTVDAPHGCVVACPQNGR